MELWEKFAWVHRNCSFASKIDDKQDVVTRAAFRSAAKKMAPKDEDDVLAMASAFFRKAIRFDISNPASQTPSPIDMVAKEIRPLLSQEFAKAKSLRKDQPLLTPDITRLTMMGFRMMQEKLKQRGIQVKDLVSLKTVVQDIVEELASSQRDLSMAVPTKDRFMHDKPTRSVEDLARQTVDRFTGKPKTQPRM